METIKKSLILIVDDTPQNVQMLGKILYDIGYSINTSTSGAHALLSVNQQPPDLVLLDIQMPEMDGFEVCKALKENAETKDIPVIFLSAVTEIDKVIAGFKLGAVDYITKPFNVSELLARVATHIELKNAREKLVELNATKDKFFSIIAHDLKNPFAGMMMSCEMLLKQLPVYEKPQIENKVQKILGSATQGFELLNNLMEWSFSQTGRIEFLPKIIDLKITIESIIQLVQAQAENKKITISCDLTENLQVNADENLLKTVIRNLITNALKFTPIGGSATIAVIKIECFIEISVSDNGVGIPREIQQNLFKVESKSSTKGTANETGTGLGLILCHEFIEKHGGKIWVESQVGKGSTFKFTLPV